MKWVSFFFLYYEIWLAPLWMGPLNTLSALLNKNELLTSHVKRFGNKLKLEPTLFRQSNFVLYVHNNDWIISLELSWIPIKQLVSLLLTDQVGTASVDVGVPLTVPRRSCSSPPSTLNQLPASVRKEWSLPAVRCASFNKKILFSSVEGADAALSTLGPLVVYKLAVVSCFC